MSRLLRLLGLGALTLSALAFDCRLHRPEDPMLDGDVWSLDTLVSEIVPLAPWIEPGPDRKLGTGDDAVIPAIQGDVDLVLRSGRTSIGGAIPAPTAAGGSGAAPLAVAEPFGEGTPVPFVVIPSDGHTPPAWGHPGAPPYWEGLPVLVAAFADLDGDGFIGRTLLDGDPLDDALEEAEWVPAGRRFAIGQGGVASGTLAIEVGGPAERPARVALVAAAWAGAFEPGFLGGNVPDGPAVMTRLPFLPELRPDRVLEGGPQGPPPAAPDALVGVEIRPAVAPDPRDPRLGEAFTVRLDGSDPTLDVARVLSGAPVRFGLAQRPDPQTYRALPERPLRPGVDDAGDPVAVEVLERLVLADDGAASSAEVRVVALDRLDDVTDPESPSLVTVRSGGVVRIVAPDGDGDPFAETVAVQDGAGTALVLDDGGGAFDGPDRDDLLVEGPDGLARVEVWLPDPDVDDSGLVDAADVAAVDAASGATLGDPDFDPHLDLDGSGRIDRRDREAVEAQLGLSVPIP